MIEVEFHNTLTHHSFSINNDIGWSMAVLNENGLVLAKEKDEDSQRCGRWADYTCTYIHVQ